MRRWRSWERQLRFVAVWGAFVALALFYIIPITAVQGLINVRPPSHSQNTKLAIRIVLNQQCMTLNDNKDAHRPLFASQSIMEADHAFTCHDTAIFIPLLCRPTWLEMSMSCLCSVPCTQAL